MHDKLLTVEQVADELNTKPRFVRRLIAERRICFHRVGRHVRIAQSDVDAFVEAGRVDPASHPTRSAPASHARSTGHPSAASR